MNKILLLIVLVGIASANNLKQNSCQLDDPKSKYYAPVPPIPYIPKMQRYFLLSFQYACS